VSILLWEAIAEPTKRYPSCHCSTMIELKNGDLLVGYYAGEGEARPDAAWVLARRSPTDEKFQQLVSVADTSGKPEGNGILLQSKDGLLSLIYGTMHGKLEGKAGPGVRWVTCDLRIKKSTDSGYTWSTAEVIEEDWGHVPRCQPIHLLNGDILFGTEFTTWHSQVWASQNDGLSWKVRGQIPGERNQHPALVSLQDGSILALIRPSGKDPKVLRSLSHDQGRTWSKAEITDNYCPFSALDAILLKDGRVVMAWNNHPEDRNPLTLGLSYDGGQTWPHKRDLIQGEGSFHYPSIIQSNDGLIHVTFTNNRRTIDHIVLTADWIEGKGRPLTNWSMSSNHRQWG